MADELWLDREFGHLGNAGKSRAMDYNGDQTRFAVIRGAILYDTNEIALGTPTNPISITGSAGSGGVLAVDVTDRIARELGVAGSEGATVSQTPEITAGAYSAGDAVGGLLTFANAARRSGGGGVIKTVTIIDDAGQDAELELWLFDRTFTAIADNSAWAPAEADLERLIGVISTEESSQGWLAAGTPSAVTIDVSARYDVTGTSMFGQLVTRGTPTYVATDDLTIKVGLLQD